MAHNNNNKTRFKILKTGNMVYKTMMDELVVEVENIKCGGCMNSIRKAVLSLPGVQAVEVSKEKESVTVVGKEFDSNSIIDKLAELGYPQKGNNSLLSKARSFISCATGRLD